MDLLKQIIAKMTKHDVRHFKLFTSRLEYGYDRKDLKLFDIIRTKNEDFSDQQAFQKLYNKKNINSYYRLKNRLLEHLNKSLIVQHFNKEENIACLFLFMVYNFHLSRQNYEVAKYYLSLAEIYAKRIEFIELLDIIYSEYINLAAELLQIDPDEYIAKRNKNFEKLKIIRDIDQRLALLSNRLKKGQNFSSDYLQVKKLEQLINQFAKEKEYSASRQFRIKTAVAISKILVQKNDFVNLEKYLKRTYSNLEKENLFNKNNHEIKLQLITYLINALFKNKKHSESLKMADKLNKAMKEYNGIFYDKYLRFYYNSLIINYSVIDLDKAISLLEEFKKEQYGKKKSFYEFFIYLNLAIFYFRKKEYSKSIQQIVKMNLLEDFMKADESLQLKIGVAEMIIRFELNDMKIFYYRMSQMEKDFAHLLNKKIYSREKKMLSFLKQIAKKQAINKKSTLMSNIKKLITQYKASSDEKEIIKYVPWLSEKLQDYSQV